MIDYAKTKWAEVNRICRRYESFKSWLHMHLGKWTGLQEEPNVVIQAHLASKEDVARLADVLDEICSAWPEEVDHAE